MADEETTLAIVVERPSLTVICKSREQGKTSWFDSYDAQGVALCTSAGRWGVSFLSNGQLVFRASDEIVRVEFTGRAPDGTIGTTWCPTCSGPLKVYADPAFVKTIQAPKPPKKG
jgi:hypothetical protein